jgi:hypothetical protein
VKLIIATGILLPLAKRGPRQDAHDERVKRFNTDSTFNDESDRLSRLLKCVITRCAAASRHLPGLVVGRSTPGNLQTLALKTASRSLWSTVAAAAQLIGRLLRTQLMCAVQVVGSPGLLA